MTVRSRGRVRRTVVVAAVLAGLLVVAAPALAHVGVTPREVDTGSTHRFEIRVPGERDDAETVEVSVDLPDELVAVAVDPVDGWTVAATTRTLAEPLALDGCTVTEVLDVVTWSGGTVATDGTGTFPLVARAPDEPATLALPTVQRYDSDEEVAWIGGPGSDDPAATIEVVPAAGAEPGDVALTCPPADQSTAGPGPDDPDEPGTAATDGTTPDGGARTEGAVTESGGEGSATDGVATQPDAPEVVAATDTATADEEPSGVLPVVAIALVVAVVTVATIVVRRR